MAGRYAVMHSPIESGSCSLRLYPGRPRGGRGCTTGGSSTGCNKIRTGISWRDLPEHYEPWKTAYTRFRSDALDGVFTRPCSRSGPRRTPPGPATGWSRSTPPSSAPTSTQPPVEKGAAPAGRTGRSRPRPIPWRTDHEDPPRLRRRGPASCRARGTMPTPRRPLRTASAGTDPCPSRRSRPANLPTRPLLRWSPPPGPHWPAGTGSACCRSRRPTGAQRRS
ncbi:transposase [Streptomyces spiralis]|uniref:transposase n=1 Tax=Streptomyces spiralis TaxID=66376 RepID=UPI00340916D9